MPIDTSLNPDFATSKLCSFLSGDYAAATYDDDATATSDWVAAGYQPVRQRGTSATQEPLFLQTYEVTTFPVRSPDGRLLFTVPVTDDVEHRLLMEVKAHLLLKPKLDPALEQSAIDAFEQSDMDDVAKVEAELIRKGLAIDDYAICLGIALTQGKPKVIHRTNREGFYEQVTKQTDRDGNLLYRLGEGQTESTCNEPTNEDSADNVLVCNPDDPIKCLEEAAKAKNPQCDGVVGTPHRIGTAFQHREWRSVTKKKRLKIGRCWTYVWIPVIESRLTKHALWGAVYSEQQIKDYFEKAMKDCLERAAIVTGVLVLVTGGGALAIAAKAFVSAVMNCLESKITDVVRCLSADLTLVKEKGDWEEKVW